MGSKSTLPRGLRTVLILIDGDKTFAEYQSLLEGKRFMDKLPALTECLEVLLDLNYIQIQEQPKSRLSKISIFDKKTKDGLSEKPVPVERIPTVKMNPSESQLNISGNGNSNQLSFKSMVTQLVEIIEQNIAHKSWSLILEVESISSFAALGNYIEQLCAGYKSELSKDSFGKLVKMVDEIKSINGDN